MKKSISDFFNKSKVILKKALVITLIMGILSSCFGIGVVALSKLTGSTEEESTSQSSEKAPANSKLSDKYKSPTDGKNAKNSLELASNVTVLTKTESDKIHSNIKHIDYYVSYDKPVLELELKGEDYDFLEDLDRGDIFFIHDKEDSMLDGDRFLQMDYISSYNDKTIVEVTEPEFEDVFTNMDVAVSDTLTEENFVDGVYADGVDSHFGDAEKEIPDAVKPTPDTEVKAPTSSDKPADDLIFDIDYNYQDNRNEENNYDSSSSFEIKGKYGIKDLTAHLISKMKDISDFEELYFGLSGDTYVDLDVSYDIDGDDKLESDKKGAKPIADIAKKSFPIASLEFKGKTPLEIAQTTSNGEKLSIVPTMYITLYANIEGYVELDLNASFEFSDSFNNGLTVAKDGKFGLTFEEFAYPATHDVEADNGFEWNIDATIDADKDITLFGSSVVFNIAGVSIGDIAVVKLGLQTNDESSVTANSSGTESSFETPDSYSYVRAYLKLLETEINLSTESDHYLKNNSFDNECNFTLRDMTLCETGEKPYSYKKSTPLATKAPPKEATSVLTLVCDVSGSMDSTIDTGQTKLESAKEAAKMVVDTTETWAKNYNESNSIGLVQFSDSAQTLCQPHTDYNYIRECISAMGDGGGTSISSGIDNGIDQLNAVSSESKIMILMTDGEDSQTDLVMQSAKNAADNKIKIYTIGFGDGVNDSLLTDVAEATGGEYRYADTNNMMGIIGSFMYAQQASTSSVLTEIEDTVREGETTDAKKFKVDDKNGDLMITTAWPGSFLDTILVDPNGKVVDENYPGAKTDETQIPSTITVSNPIKGDWEVSVKGVETSYEEEPFYTIVAFKESRNAKLNTQMSTIEIIAAYCIPIGMFLILASVLFLFGLGKNKKTKEENKTE